MIILSILRKHKRSGAMSRCQAGGSPRATRSAENSSETAPDSLLTLQPIGGQRLIASALLVCTPYDPCAQDRALAGNRSREIVGRDPNITNIWPAAIRFLCKNVNPSRPGRRGNQLTTPVGIFA